MHTYDPRHRLASVEYRRADDQELIQGFYCEYDASGPNEPRYDQIVDGDKLRDSGADLSHYDNGWQDQGGTAELTAGVDFDHVILAAALPSLPAPARSTLSGLTAVKPTSTFQAGSARAGAGRS